MEAGAIMSESNGGTAGRGNEGIEATDAAELMDYRDMSVLAQFHEDAITQV